MKTMIKDTLILFAITLVAGALLGFVNELTKEPIAQYEADKKASACGEVFYEVNEDGELAQVAELTFEACSEEEIKKLNEDIKDKIQGNIVIDEVYRAYLEPSLIENENISDMAEDSAAGLGTIISEDSFYGYVIGVTTKEGYNGEISFYVGITKEGRLKGVSLLQIAETPGLGMNAESVLLPQFRDVEAGHFTVVKTGAVGPDEIDAITSATITSDAITGGVNAAYECYILLQEGGDAS